ncbi:MAG: type II toxin-antitoxin system RelE/ParE family toxin [Bacteroidota bacterium]|nr:type II toxin-antitoxin system RelE/ParE family toxin [Bacteroidota bacterium]
MSFALIIQDAAILEIKDAFDWYEEQKDGLGHEFIKEIEACCNSLSKYPERYSYINDLYRRIKTNRFPYIIIYEIYNDTIIILRVRHLKQKPID